MWHIWPGQLWPADDVTEEALVAALHERVKRPAKATRDDVTALLTILRCGSSLEHVLEFAPGIRLAGLLGAHQRLDQLRATSVRAWDTVAANPSLPVWSANAKAASQVFPVAVDRVVAALESDPTGRRLPSVVGQIQQRMNEMAAAATEIENRCATTPRTLPQAGALSSLLYNPHGPCVYTDPFYVPRRVAVLSPTRVGDLLGENRH